MSKDIERDFNVGGTVEQALSGQYQLKVGEVLKESWDTTLKHFVSFFSSNRSNDCHTNCNIFRSAKASTW